MIDFLPDPPRWKDRHDQANLAERSAGQAARALANEPALSPGQLERVAARLRAPHARRRRIWIPLTAAFVLTAATATAAHLGLLPRVLMNLVRPAPPPSGSPPAPTAPTQRSTTRPRQATTGESSATVTPPPSIPTPVATPPDRAAPVDTTTARPSPANPTMPPPRSDDSKGRKVAMHRPPPIDLPPTAPPPSAGSLAPTEAVEPVPLPAAPAPTTRPAPEIPALPVPGKEAKALTEVVRILRVDRQPQRALARLDRDAPLLARGGFGHEALLLRVEAMLALHRDAETLALLDATPLAPQAAHRSLLITRGTLRAQARRCPEALADLDRAAALSNQPLPQAEAARATCRGR